jgi:hypothetical protein
MFGHLTAPVLVDVDGGQPPDFGEYGPEAAVGIRRQGLLRKEQDPVVGECLANGGHLIVGQPVQIYAVNLGAKRGPTGRTTIGAALV